ncbi:MAG: hypothetical protein N0A00_01570 [Candidatus Bathyarchaeota archaeon]|nr:hypothetical protein [Candidatus Bathyarchaeota archaeon]
MPEIVAAVDIKEIGELCTGARRLALQQFIAENSYEERFRRLKPYQPETLRRFADALKPYVDEVLIRA